MESDGGEMVENSVTLGATLFSRNYSNGRVMKTSQNEITATISLKYHYTRDVYNTSGIAGSIYGFQPSH